MQGQNEREEEEEEGGVSEIIIGREMCYPQGLLLIASLMSLWDVLVVYWICIQLCRLRGVGISAQQTTAQFDMDFFFLYSFLSALTACFPLEVQHPPPPPPPPPPIKKSPSCDGLASCECQNCFVAF